MSRSCGAFAFILLLAAAPALAGDKELARDTGNVDGKRSSAGTGHVVAFETPKGDWSIRAVRIHGMRYGGGYDPAATFFTVAVTDRSLKPLASVRVPYEKFDLGKWKWVEVALPTPVKAPGGFKVVASFEPTASRGVYMGWSTVEKSHSGYGLPGGGERPYAADKDWMIRAVLTDKAPKEDTGVVELALDDGAKTGEQSIGGGGHIVEFRKPSGTWWIRSVRLYGKRYGGGYDPTATFYSVWLANPALKPFHEEKAKYSAFGTASFGWVDLPLTKAVKAPARFKVAVGFDATATKGVYLGYADAKKLAAWSGLPGGKPKRWEKGQWMIRVVLTKEKPTPPEPEPEPKHGPAVYLKDFEFVEKTVARKFPALEKKGVDWKAVCKEWRPRFAKCPDDKTHVMNARRLLAILNDGHTGLTRTSVPVHSPGFDGLYGAGMWVAVDGERIVLRAILPGHPLAKKLEPGMILLTVDGKPAGQALDATRAQVREWSGMSSTHFLDARLSFQFFRFGKKQTLRSTWLGFDGQEVQATLPRWGPGGRGLSRQAVTMPIGLEAKGLAVSTKLPGDIGHVRILGGMNDATRDAFYKAFDDLKGVKGMILDCRGMGGGGDHPAWAMAGRFFEKSTPLEAGSTIQPTGAWQFDGPVVMLQDEREASSAETFTWAMVETGRVVSVGRPTAGMTIIPTTFDAPSGIFSFRMGVHDRKTPIRRVQPEGIGTPPDVFVPYAPHLLAEGQDPCRRIGLEILRRLMKGEDRETVVEAYGAVLGGDAKRLPEKVRSLSTDLLMAVGKHAAGLAVWERFLRKAGHGDADREKRALAVVDALGE